MHHRTKQIGCSVLAALFVAGPAIGAGQVAGAPPAVDYYATYGVADWRGTATERAVEFKTFRRIVLENATYSDDEKAAKIAAKYTRIATEVRAERRAAYAAVERTVTVGHSCTKGDGPGSKACDAKCESAPLPDMYTSLDWVRGWWGSGGEPEALEGSEHQMGDDRVAGDTQVCAGKLKISGSGKKSSFAKGVFRIRPARIDQIVTEEMVPIMSTISDTPS